MRAGLCFCGGMPDCILVHLVEQHQDGRGQTGPQRLRALSAVCSVASVRYSPSSVPSFAVVCALRRRARICRIARSVCFVQARARFMHQSPVFNMQGMYMGGFKSCSTVRRGYEHRAIARI